MQNFFNKIWLNYKKKINLHIEIEYQWLAKLSKLIWQKARYSLGFSARSGNNDLMRLWLRFRGPFLLEEFSASLSVSLRAPTNFHIHWVYITMGRYSASIAALNFNIAFFISKRNCSLWRHKFSPRLHFKAPTTDSCAGTQRSTISAELQMLKCETKATEERR